MKRLVCLVLLSCLTAPSMAGEYFKNAESAFNRGKLGALSDISKTSYLGTCVSSKDERVRTKLAFAFLSDTFLGEGILFGLESWKNDDREPDVVPSLVMLKDADGELAYHSDSNDRATGKSVVLRATSVPSDGRYLILRNTGAWSNKTSVTYCYFQY